MEKIRNKDRRASSIEKGKGQTTVDEEEMTIIFQQIYNSLKSY